MRRKIFCTALLFITVYCVFSIFSKTFATENTTLNLQVNCDYEKAFEVLEIVNEERANENLNPLKMDSTLLNIAVQRCAETVVYWSHTRPNETSCFTAFTNSHITAGENIALGQSTATSVMNSWMNSTGHRANILNSNFESIGILAINVNGMNYWVQVFEGGAQIDEVTSATKPENRIESVDVEISQNILAQSLQSVSGLEENITLIKGNIKENDIIFSCKTVDGLNTKFSAYPSEKQNLFTSSDTSVATVDYNGNITGISVGTTNINLICGNIEKNCEVTIEKDPLENIKFELNSNGTGYILVKCSDKELTNLNIPNQYKGLPVVEIGDNAFYYEDNTYLANLTEITIPETVTRIGENAFANCTGLTAIIIPNSVIEMGNAAFAKCSNLKELTIGTGLKIIPNEAFNFCFNIENIIIPDNIEEIGDYAFQSVYNNVKEITLSNNLKRIGIRAFNNLNRVSTAPIEEIIIPDSIEVIDDRAFENTNVKNIILPNKNITFGARVFQQSQIIEIEIPSTITQITDYMFSGASKLQTISLPDTLESIGEYAFEYDDALEKIVIPRNVKSIDSTAFSNCSNFATICGYLGSYAETFAKENNYQFEPLDNYTTIETTEITINEEEHIFMEITKGQTVTDFINEENFPVFGTYEITVYDASGQIKDSEAKVGSKNIIKITNNDNVLIEYVVIVKGDVTGDGLVKMYDSFEILKGSLFNYTIDDIDVLIRDYNNDGKVKMYDAFAFLKTALFN